MGGPQPRNGVSPQSLGPGQQFWSLQRQITSFSQAIALFIFLLHFGAFDNIFEQKDVLFSLFHTLAFISHYKSETGDRPLSKTSSTAETATPCLPSLGNTIIAILGGSAPEIWAHVPEISLH